MFDPKNTAKKIPFIPARPWTGANPPKKILAIRLQANGDTMITLPYLNALRRQLPSTRLDFLTRVECESIPKNLRLFDHVYSIAGQRNFKKQLAYTLLMLPKLMSRGYDTVLDLQNNILSEIVRKAIRPKAWSVFDRFSPLAAGERTRLTIEAAGFGPLTMNPLLDLKNDFDSRKRLMENGWDGRSALVVLNPAAAFTTRNWPTDYYVELAGLWLHHYPATQFLMLGTSFIQQKTLFLKEQLGDYLIDLVGKTTQIEAFSVLQQASLMISEDSGLMHMAWTSGVPTLAIFGGTRSDWARPLGAHSFFLDSSDLACGNCMLETCRFGDVRCMTRYTPELILAHAKTLFEKRRLQLEQG